jgi:hypothetical protein
MADASHISAANALERGDRTAMFQSGAARRAADNDESQRERKRRARASRFEHRARHRT